MLQLNFFTELIQLNLSKHMLDNDIRRIQNPHQTVRLVPNLVLLSHATPPIVSSPINVTHDSIESSTAAFTLYLVQQILVSFSRFPTPCSTNDPWFYEGGTLSYTIDCHNFITIFNVLQRIMIHNSID